jgi:hypothetical protein
VSVGLAAALELTAGAVLVRLVRWSPYGSFSEAVAFGLVGALVKDVFLLLALGGVGHFRPVALIVLDVMLAAGVLVLRPFLEREPEGGSASVGPRLPSVAWVLPLVLWSIPVWLLLASPVVPAPDVLPTLVAPVQHVETFGSWDRLAVDPSPIAGEPRLSLGYVALLGSLTSLTSLPATLVVAGFALPLTVLLAAGSYHLCRLMGGRAAGYCALLLVPLAYAFLRLPDARPAVLALPLAAAALGLTVAEHRDGSRPSPLAGRSRPVLLAAAVGAAMIVHPPIGMFAAMTVLVLGLVREPAFRRVLLAGLLGALIAALPQVALVLDIDLPAWVGLPAWPLGLGVAAAVAGPGPRRGDLSETLAPTGALGRGWLVLGALAVVAIAFAGSWLVLQLDPAAPRRLAPVVAAAATAFPVLLLALGVAVVMTREVRTWTLIGVALLVGVLGTLAGAAVPGDSLVGAMLRQDLPDAAGYWTPWILALAGGLGLGAMWRRDAWPGALRAGIAGAVISLAALPLPFRTVDGSRADEHHYAETAALVLHEAEDGGWPRFPDARRVIDADGTALVGALVREWRAGRVGPRTELLHVAPSFQAWVATPVAAWTGIFTTSASMDPEMSAHTAGGRLRGLDELEALPGPYRYVVVQGLRAAGPHDATVRAAGFRPIATGADWRLYRLD